MPGVSKSRFQMVLPSLALMHRSDRLEFLSSLSSAEQVMNSFSPQSTGDECPIPGSCTFQLKSLSVNLAGILADGSAMPVPSGPRKRVHSCALANEGSMSKATKRTGDFIESPGWQKTIRCLN